MLIITCRRRSHIQIRLARLIDVFLTRWFEKISASDAGSTWPKLLDIMLKSTVLADPS